MPRYIVGVKEVHVQEIVIEADSKEGAIFEIEGGAGEERNLEYDYTLDSDEWSISQLDDEEQPLTEGIVRRRKK